MSAKILITYTTKYREGGAKFKIAAKTMLEDKKNEFPDFDILCEAVETKTEFIKLITSAGPFKEIHFIGHSGLYGIMFGTRKHPEQLSPYEWKQLNINFTEDGSIFFHACRTAVWFAQFIANTLKVKAYGHRWYTSFSTTPVKFSASMNDNVNKLYIRSVPGKTSHGILSSIPKYLGTAKPFPMSEFTAEVQEFDRTYQEVAEKYAKTFSDFTVRNNEWKWLKEKIESIKPESILDIGCGNGSFLRAIGDTIPKKYGIDQSSNLLAFAKETIPDGEFKVVDSPKIPFPDNSMDLVTSILCFRYLDWDPIMKEISRVLKPAGKVIVLDLAAAPAKVPEFGTLLYHKYLTYQNRLKRPEFYKNLKNLVSSPAWHKMVKNNPMRSAHEFTWYLESRFPNGKIDLIDLGMHSRTLGFYSGKVDIEHLNNSLSTIGEHNLQ